ncbi:hypothetical protein DQ04_07451010 [Trypanosoma grayi]|uniref:hypothetical protein n=1 Tax=Trypanosoma grayi TaxID=71804 RepID=UPI0004F43729|nr:hypothetical protein DQ04_07451010 [Trypanosoma grayi]KEG08322.1 hypothetical protein DQ04_07451010 [Trypanosoma grayi]
MPAKKRSVSKKKKAPPPPPPVVLYASNQEEFDAVVLNHQGSSLVAVLAPFCNLCSRTVMPYLEKLNAERPSALAALNIVVVNASDELAALCQSLEVVAVPSFFAYSYGKQLHSFAGDNVEKVLLIARLAAQQAEVDKKEAAAAEEGGVEAQAVAAAE